MDQPLVIEAECETSESAEQVLEGHSGRETEIAANIDGRRIFSCLAYVMLTIWDTAPGTEIDKMSQGIGFICVSVCCGSLRRALGFDVGTLRVLDGTRKSVLFEDTRAHEKKI